MTLNLATLLEDSARRHPGRDAVVLGDTRLTYAQVDAAANQVANLLVAHGIAPGDTVALSCPNVPHFPILYYGILKAGAVVVPLNVLLKSREIAYHLADSQAKAYFIFEGLAEPPSGESVFVFNASSFSELVEGQPSTFDTVQTSETDTAVILYTSGTTGQPKGAELSHSNLMLNALTSNRLFGSLATGHDRHLLTLPLFHSFGSTAQMNAGFAVASTLVLMPRFDAKQAVALLQTENITFFAGVPTMYWGLLGALDDTVDVAAIAATMRVAVSGGASLPVEIIKRFKERFGVQILEGYGLSETSPVATFSDPEREPRAGSIGVPIWGVEVKLIDPEWKTIEGAGEIGEIAIRGHNIMKGYLHRAEATREVMHDGWFRTGDLARRDEDGFYYIVDRAKDMIIRGGFNVYPREIEEVLLTHPAVSLAAVIGVPHESLGEEVKAFIIRKPEAEVGADEIIAWCKENMASYKYPRIVEFAETLPMTATGKILKRELAR